jgi:nicotinamide-nucleotide amidase
MTAEIVAIGDELLIGQVVNTNAAWIGERLTGIGAHVARAAVLGDDLDGLVRELDLALRRADFVVVTGGLGPTHDDVTKEAVCRLFGVELREDPDILAAVRARFARRGIRMAESNVGQAAIPDGFIALPNAHGTAPGLWRDADSEGRGTIVLLPGVPYEMKALMEEAVLPRLQSRPDVRSTARRTLLTTGIGESNLQELFGDLSAWLDRNTGLAYLPSIHGVRLRISAEAESVAQAQERVAGFADHLCGIAGRFVYGSDGDTLEAVVGRVLADRGWTIATAESCTGGLVASRITDVPGSSRYFGGGVVAYANSVKEDALGVSPDLLEEHGAVSGPVVEAMAAGVRTRFGADVGVATSGIMGPGGGSEEKPVGTVWLAADIRGEVRAVRVRLGGTRDRNKEQAATAALNLVRLRLLKLG